MPIDELEFEQHTHDGLNSKKVKHSDLAPFDFVSSAPTHKAEEGSMVAVNTGSAVILYVYGNSTWNAIGGATKAHVKAYLSGVQEIGDSTKTTVGFDSETFDSGGDFASNTFTAPRDGYYHVNVNLLMEVLATGDLVKIYITRDNTDQFWNQYYTTATDYETFSVSGTVYCTANQTIVAKIYHEAGTTADITGGQATCNITIDEL